MSFYLGKYYFTCNWSRNLNRYLKISPISEITASTKLNWSHNTNLYRFVPQSTVFTYKNNSYCKCTEMFYINGYIGYLLYWDIKKEFVTYWIVDTVKCTVYYVVNEILLESTTGTFAFIKLNCSFTPICLCSLLSPFITT